MAETTSAPKELLELTSFLSDTKPLVRKMAVNHVASLSGSLEGRNQLKTIASLLPTLVALCSDADTIAYEALTALVNLTQDRDTCLQLLKTNLLTQLVESITDEGNRMSLLQAPLLSNMTIHDECCQQLLAKSTSETQPVHKLMNVFISSGEKTMPETALTQPTTAPMKEEKDPLCWIGTALLNLTQRPEGRKKMMSKKTKYIPSLLRTLQHPNPVRRRGVIGIIRNCLFDQDYHDFLLSPEIELVPYLLYPLLGPEPFPADDQVGMYEFCLNVPPTKKREPDEHARRMLVECLLLLTTNKKERQFLRDRKTYPILRELDKEEQVEANKEVILKVVEMLIRDEEEDVKPQPTQPGDQPTTTS